MAWGGRRAGAHRPWFPAGSAVVGGAGLIGIRLGVAGTVRVVVVLGTGEGSGVAGDVPAEVELVGLDGGLVTVDGLDTAEPIPGEPGRDVPRARLDCAAPEPGFVLDGAIGVSTTPVRDELSVQHDAGRVDAVGARLDDSLR